MACVCGKGYSTELCCGRFLSGQEWPATAEELMRSRFSAFATRNPEYLRETATIASPTDYQGGMAWEWERLEIVETQAGGPQDEEGIVEFRAYFKEPGGRPGVVHERSSFARVDGRWLYTEGHPPGQVPLVRDGPRVGRNEPCPCGSGKKFKKCCSA